MECAFLTCLYGVALTKDHRSHTHTYHTQKKTLAEQQRNERMKDKKNQFDFYTPHIQNGQTAKNSGNQQNGGLQLGDFVSL